MCATHSAVDQAFRAGGAVDGVIHFAGLKAAGESVAIHCFTGMGT